MGRAERKRVKDLVATLAWSVPEMKPRIAALPQNPDGLEEAAEFDVLPGVRALLFPHGEQWRALFIQSAPDGRILSTLEHQLRSPDDVSAPRWSMFVFRDILASVIQSAPEDATLAQERHAKVDALADRL